MIGRTFQALALAVLLWPTVGHSATLGDSIVKREKYCTPESGSYYNGGYWYCVVTCLANETAISGWSRTYSRSKKTVGGGVVNPSLRSPNGWELVPVGRWYVNTRVANSMYLSDREAHVAILCIPTGPHRW